MSTSVLSEKVLFSYTSSLFFVECYIYIFESVISTPKRQLSNIFGILFRSARVGENYGGNPVDNSMGGCGTRRQSVRCSIPQEYEKRWVQTEINVGQDSIKSYTHLNFQNVLSKGKERGFCPSGKLISLEKVVFRGKLVYSFLLFVGVILCAAWTR